VKYKTCELVGARLDAAVAKADGWTKADDDPSGWRAPKGHAEAPCASIDQAGIRHGYGYHPAHNWKHGGPIIEREGIELHCIDRNSRRTMGEWMARHPAKLLPLQFGTTPLIAAMRAFVASNLGEEVELPCY